MRMSPGTVEALLPRKTWNMFFETGLHNSNENSDPNLPYVDVQTPLEGKLIPETVINLEGKTYSGKMEPDISGAGTM